MICVERDSLTCFPQLAIFASAPAAPPDPLYQIIRDVIFHLGVTR